VHGWRWGVHGITASSRRYAPTSLAGELTLQDMESFNDQPIARGVGDTATDVIKTMRALKWKSPRNG
jgi:hypothetical protein